ncbi:MAG: SDR family NAD(P)-dependent oxidoreductase [Rhizobiaceae bacterium]
MSFKEKYGPWGLIAGASDGIGLAFARRLAGEGLNLILVARNQAKLDAAAADVKALGVDCITVSADLSKPDGTDKAIAAAGDREVGLVVTNCGADSINSKFLDADIAEWQGLAEMNVGTKMRLAHHFGRQMRERGRGGLILINSGACYSGMFGLATYCGSKGFVLNFSEGLWAELRHHGIDVLTMVLGQTDTPSYRATLARSGQPLPDNWADPDDVAATALRQLPEGPVFNWGQTNDVAGMAPNSPDDRRARIVMIEQMTGDLTERA